MKYLITVSLLTLIACSNIHAIDTAHHEKHDYHILMSSLLNVNEDKYTYIDEKGERKTPVMLHRAILGSFERFIGMLIEHYAGNFPAWLAPQQVCLLNITDNQAEYCLEMEESLKKLGFRVAADLRNEKIGFKIREHTLQKVPYLLVAGDKEVESRTVSVRSRSGDDLGSMSLEAFVTLLQKDIARAGRIDAEK